jgi:hypothetical protein
MDIVLSEPTQAIPNVDATEPNRTEARMERADVNAVKSKIDMLELYLPTLLIERAEPR